MATNRREITRGRKQLDVSPALQDYFFTGDNQREKQLPGWQSARWQCLCDKEELLSLWQHNRDALLKIWIADNPCRRPYFWWKVDSPRTRIEPFNVDFPGQRLRLGGIGSTFFDRYRGIAPSFIFGLPESWYVINDDDPPVYESEAAYLSRHGLLKAAEVKHLAKHPELLEPVKVILSR